jgi:hypothetical protein
MCGGDLVPVGGGILAELYAELNELFDNEEVTITIRRKDMRQSEIEKLPEL